VQLSHGVIVLLAVFRPLVFMEPKQIEEMCTDRL